MSETDIVRSILKALALRRVLAWRANAGLLVLGKGADKRVVRGAPAGTPDIIGILPGGRFFGLEVKTQTGRVSPAQHAWADRARELGARYQVVRSAREAIAALDSWIQEEAA
jgi:hypothetical protein